jgi:hypothetical protein
MLRAHLSPVEGLCEARLTKRSTSEVGLGATVVGVSLIGKPRIFFPAILCPARNMTGEGVPVSPGDGKSRSIASVLGTA